MKQLFTLVAMFLLSTGSSFAQSEWVNLVVNGNMEGEANPKWSSFWCHDWRRGVEFDAESGQGYDKDNTETGQFQGFAEIVEDPADPTNHCARVICRSEAQADEMGNKIVDSNGNFASWDSQFFIYATDTIPQGQELRLTMKVKADKAGSLETQAHWTPGDYNHWQMFGNVDVTTEWKKVELTATIDASMTGESSGKHMQSVAFNLATNKEGITFYFDDIKLEMRTPKGPEEFTGWFNMLRHGTQSADKIGNYTTFTGRNGIDNKDVQAKVIIDEDGQPALTVAAIGYNAFTKDTTYVEVKDDEGNTVVDAEGNPVTEMEIEDKPIYITEAGDTLKLQNSSDYGIDDFRTQFFVTTNHKYVQGEKMHVKFSARADKDQQVDTQVHRMPGDYQHWQFLGSFDLTPEWQDFDLEVEIGSDHKGGQTIAFNCNKLKDEDSNIFFRFEEVSFNIGDVTEAERVLGQEDARIPVVGDNSETEGVLDFTNCKEVLEFSSLYNVVKDNMSMLSGDDEFTSVDFSAGVFLTNTGLVSSDPDDDLLIEFEEPGDEDTQLKAKVSNFAEEAFTQPIDTKIRFSFNNWFYVFNTQIVPEETFLGIADTNIAKKATGAIYDLSGRKISKPVKGLYIMDGKKFIMK